MIDIYDILVYLLNLLIWCIRFYEKKVPTSSRTVLPVVITPLAMRQRTPATLRFYCVKD